MPEYATDSFYSPYKLYHYETLALSEIGCLNIAAKSVNLEKIWSLIIRDFICTETIEGYSFLDGYSGNSLVINNTLYGISVPNEPNVFANVFEYKKWIQDNINL